MRLNSNFIINHQNPTYPFVIKKKNHFVHSFGPIYLIKREPILLRPQIFPTQLTISIFHDY